MRPTRLGIAFLFLLLFVGLFPSQNSIHEVVISGIPYTWCTLLLFLAFRGSVLLPRERRLMWAGFLAVSIIIGSWLQPFFFGRRSAAADGPRLKVIAANVEFSNTHYNDFLAILDRERPDILGITEVTDDWHRAIVPRFPYSAQVRGDPGYGIGLYSRFPLEKVDFSLGDDLPPVAMATLSPDAGRTISIFLFHAIGPQLPETVPRNKLIYRRLAAKVRETNGDKIIMGDFNVTPFSIFYRLFLYWTDTHNAADGFGFFRTWDADYFPLRFWIDHILYQGGLIPVDFRTLDSSGSDHLPVMAEFQLSPAATGLQAQR